MTTLGCCTLVMYYELPSATHNVNSTQIVTGLLIELCPGLHYASLLLIIIDEVHKLS